LIPDRYHKKYIYWLIKANSIEGLFAPVIALHFSYLVSSANQ